MPEHHATPTEMAFSGAHYCMSAEELDARVEAAVMRGVSKALHSVGLGDEEAAKDVTEMRSLLSSWRATKSELWKQVLHWTVTAALGAIAGFLYFKTGGKAP